MPSTKFNVVIDEAFANFCEDSSLEPIDRKNLLSFCNDYEEGIWRANVFQRFVWDNVGETALSEDERQALAGDHATALSRAASRMRLTKDETAETKGAGSELAEIFLYGIMRKHFGAIPAVPKIFYKQNVKDNAKGADSVHITVANDDFQIWYGEAKFYNSIENARLAEIIKSVGNSLDPDKIRKENSIITGVCQLDKYISDPHMLEELKHLLDEDTTTDRLKPKLHIPIFILHECDIVAGKNDFDDGLRDELIEHHKERANVFFKKQIEQLQSITKYDQISFTLILFPVPNKEDILDRYISRVKEEKGH